MRPSVPAAGTADLNSQRNAGSCSRGSCSDSGCAPGGEDKLLFSWTEALINCHQQKGKMGEAFLRNYWKTPNTGTNDNKRHSVSRRGKIG
ncbi:hypothetical protein Y1Q_0017477 [Alligator mississippiensis]|uniref:Uncharacterized protein n=1 Tax=Alligator mississippiensis TaxID=8496 RepID=A0A151P237_ALLMI|nr:hypothetical protein Y1Q_0017477 [Alligator mississippiensis]